VKKKVAHNSFGSDAKVKTNFTQEENLVRLKAWAKASGYHYRTHKNKDGSIRLMLYLAAHTETKLFT
jgi:hypothetical protein